MLVLKEAVGAGCSNLKDDVLLVQGLLNQADPKPQPPLKVDGGAGSKTLAALTLFIEREMAFCPVEGVKLQPGSVYWQKLLKPTELPRPSGGAKLAEEDFATAAKTLNVEVAAVKAVNDVESGRYGGYFASGRPLAIIRLCGRLGTGSGGRKAAGSLRKPSAANGLGFWGLISRFSFNLRLRAAVSAKNCHCPA